MSMLMSLIVLIAAVGLISIVLAVIFIASLFEDDANRRGEY
jgi:hypothetical protein